MRTKILSIIYSMLVTVFLTICLLWYYGIDSNLYISDFYTIEIQTPNKKLNTYYLKPESINDVFLFGNSTNGQFFSEQISDSIIKFENTSSIGLVLTRVGNDGNQTDYKILRKNQKYVLKEIPSSFSKSYYITYHILKSLIISILFSLIVFLISKKISKRIKFSLSLSLLGFCYYTIVYYYIHSSVSNWFF